MILCSRSMCCLHWVSFLAGGRRKLCDHEAAEPVIVSGNVQWALRHGAEVSQSMALPSFQGFVAGMGTYPTSTFFYMMIWFMELN